MNPALRGSPVSIYANVNLFVASVNYVVAITGGLEPFILRHAQDER
jgi:hypothetical protein